MTHSVEQKKKNMSTGNCNTNLNSSDLCELWVIKWLCKAYASEFD
jgi:hypothetical protein